MKENYQKPYLEEIYFQDTDIITTSTAQEGGGNEDDFDQIKDNFPL